MLLDGLPEESRLRRADPSLAPWGYLEELLAQLLEELSVLTSDRRRKEPLSVPRPGAARAAARTPSGGKVASGARAMQAQFGAQAAARGAARVKAATSDV